MLPPVAALPPVGSVVPAGPAGLSCALLIKQPPFSPTASQVLAAPAPRAPLPMALAASGVPAGRCPDRMCPGRTSDATEPAAGPASSGWGDRAVPLEPPRRAGDRVWVRAASPPPGDGGRRRQASERVAAGEAGYAGQRAAAARFTRHTD